MSQVQAGFGQFDYVRELAEQRDQRGWWHSFELPDGTQIRGVCSVEGLRRRLDQFPIPSDLTGKRVLDVGAWDGWYSFELERRGAEVTAVDCWENPRFHEMRERLRSRVNYRILDIYELTPQKIGRFHIVLFLGVLYHLKHPLLGLERICALTTELAAVDSFVLREEHRPGIEVEKRSILEFYETDEFGGQTDNWVGPSTPCLLALCRTAGFARVELRAELDYGACVACFRKWEPILKSEQPPPILQEVFHHTNYGLNFRSHLDEYIGATFDYGASDLALDDVKPEVSGYGVRPIYVRKINGRWHANFKLPPGLWEGSHDVTIRVGSSPPSNSRVVYVDMLPNAGIVEIQALGDGTTWEAGELDFERGNILVLWIAGLPKNADRANIRVMLAGQRLSVIFVEAAVEASNDTPRRQINTIVPEAAPPGIFPVVIECGETASAPASVRIRGRSSRVTGPGG